MNNKIDGLAMKLEAMKDKAMLAVFREEAHKAVMAAASQEMTAYDGVDFESEMPTKKTLPAGDPEE